MTEPRTPRQFADAGMVVRVACRCGHEQHLDPLMVEFMYGERFDLVADWRELAAVLRCEACNSPRPIITFEPAKISDKAPAVTVALRRAVGGMQ